jgi:hypothetical protein
VKNLTKTEGRRHWEDKRRTRLGRVATRSVSPCKDSQRFTGTRSVKTSDFGYSFVRDIEGVAAKSLFAKSLTKVHNFFRRFGEKSGTPWEKMRTLRQSHSFDRFLTPENRKKITKNCLSIKNTCRRSGDGHCNHPRQLSP